MRIPLLLILGIDIVPVSFSAPARADADSSLESHNYRNIATIG